MMTHLDRQEFLAWAYGDLLTNTTRGALAEYIVATALGIGDEERIEWDQYDLHVGGEGVHGFGVEVKSAAYVQAWKQTRPSEIVFNIRPAKGWDARSDTYAASAGRSAAVYVFCLLNGTDRKRVNPLDVAQWTFYVLPTSVLNQEVKEQRTIRLGPLKALCQYESRTYEELNESIHQAANINRVQIGDAPAP